MASGIYLQQKNIPTVRKANITTTTVEAWRRNSLTDSWIFSWVEFTIWSSDWSDWIPSFLNLPRGDAMNPIWKNTMIIITAPTFNIIDDWWEVQWNKFSSVSELISINWYSILFLLLMSNSHSCLSDDKVTSTFYSFFHLVDVFHVDSFVYRHSSAAISCYLDERIIFHHQNIQK